MTPWSCVALKKTLRPRVGSSFQILPREAKCQGEVIAIGPGGRDENGKLIPIDLKVGDVVLFGKWSGTEVKLDGAEYLIMKESDLMGVIEGKMPNGPPPKSLPDTGSGR